MKIRELLDQLSRHGVQTTEAEINDLLGNVEHLTQDDIPALVEMFQSNAPDPNPPKSTKRGSKLAKNSAKPTSPSFEITKSDSSSLVQPVDPNQLPEVSNLSNSEVAQWIGKVEQMQTQGKVQDDRIIQFLGELYTHRQRAIDFSRDAALAFQQQDAELLKATEQLNQAVTTSLKTSEQYQQLRSALSGEEVGHLAQTFHTANREPSLTERFNAFIKHPGQPGSETEIPAA